MNKKLGVRVRKSWCIDPTEKIIDSRKAYSRKSSKQSLKRQLELMDESFDETCSSGYQPFNS